VWAAPPCAVIPAVCSGVTSGSVGGVLAVPDIKKRLLEATGLIQEGVEVTHSDDASFGQALIQTSYQGTQEWCDGTGAAHAILVSTMHVNGVTARRQCGDVR
jgi:hypothetical protein